MWNMNIITQYGLCGCELVLGLGLCDYVSGLGVGVGVGLEYGHLHAHVPIADFTISGL